MVHVSRSLTCLVHPAYLRAEAFVCAAEVAGIPLIVTCTRRSAQAQEALYAQGRADIGLVNKLRVECGLPAISEEENRRRVTNARAGDSLHQYGVALDVVPLSAGKPVWDAGAAIWQCVGAIGEQVGFEWAGRWKRFREMPHFQFTGGLSLSDFKLGQTPAG